MTKGRFDLIVKRKQKIDKENIEMKGTEAQKNIIKFGGYLEGKILCRQCREPIQINDKVVSMLGGGGTKQYHYTCAEMLKIV